MARKAEWKGNKLYMDLDGFALVFDRDNASTDCDHQAARMGWRDRFLDAIGAKDLTPAERAEKVRRMIEHYHTGTTAWELTPASAGSDVVRAVMAAYKIELDAARDRIARNAEKLGVSEATMRQRLVTADGPVRNAYLAILAERGTASKGESLLGDFT